MSSLSQGSAGHEGAGRRSRPLKVTLDTGCSEDPVLVEALRQLGADVAITSTTASEINGSSFSDVFHGLDRKTGPGGWGLNWGECWGGGNSVDYLDRDGVPHHGNPFVEILEVISNGGVKLPKDWDTLTKRQCNLIHDAMILSTHVQHQRDLFVTDDYRAFVNADRRETLERMFPTKILTLKEARIRFLGTQTS
jgi:hypothetical protein